MTTNETPKLIKITIEIQNDTGLEFEEVAECSKLRMGEYYVDIDGKVQRSHYTIVGCKCIVLTPKIDAELEEAKRLIGKYFSHNNKNHIFIVKNVVRLHENIYISDGCEHDYILHNCTPFPIPVWRCCESDKPKKDGRYFTRDIDTKGWMKANNFKDGRWSGEYERDEWLDEGGE